VTDRVSLRGLRAHGHHGVLPFERANGQEFVVDVELELHTSPAATSDELDDTVDYGALAEQLAAVVTGDPVNLIETLAERLAAVCLRDPRVQAVTVEVHKPKAPVTVPVDDISVRIRREQA
jgi:7,8-dihydroneopterin aldolase/epimerase/oxygenase